MIKFNPKFIFIILFFTIVKANAQNTVRVIGAMKKTMWKGEIGGKIEIDTIKNFKNLYGLGPLENLAGEVMILDGVVYKSWINDKSSMVVETNAHIKAPFFAYGNVAQWKSIDVAGEILTLEDLEEFIENQTNKYIKPLFFKIDAVVEEATIHVVNLPIGTKVASPDDAHRGQQNFKLSNQKVQLLGFYSKSHKAIFTHHDTDVHIHLMTDDKKQMGHLESLIFKPKSVKLALPTL